MKLLSCALITLVLSIPLSLQQSSLAAAQIDPPALSGPSGESATSTAVPPSCIRYNALNNLIRDGKIGKRFARNEMKRLLAEVRQEYYLAGGTDQPSATWVFPLAGYDARAIEKGRHHGFLPRGYDFFTGNRHGGHPAYDIFIHDREQQSLDDRNGRAVQVLSVTGGIVVALEREWAEGSSLRGGKYIWIYDPANDLLVYYAHNGELFVELGEIVKPGDVLATVGRSGFNAAKQRSPTHLHLSVLRVRDGRPVPVDVYRQLAHAAVRVDN
jgi:peptidoglycan LD-endopeptidase LytH